MSLNYMSSSQINPIIQRLPTYSYTLFYLLNRPTTREQRRQALKKYLDKTRREKSSGQTHRKKSKFVRS